MSARSKRRNLPKRIGVAIAALALLFLLGSLIRVPILRDVAGFVFSGPQRALRDASSVGRLRSENERLRRDAARLAFENFTLREARFENARLRRMLEFSAASGFRLVPASIVAREAGPFARGLKLNKGARAGLRVNMPVVNHDGLIGKLISVDRDAAYVQVIEDPDFRVSTLIQRSRTAGILAWNPGKGVEMFDVPHHADAESGDLVVTSGLGEVFPKGILIGRVTEVSDRQGLLFQIVHVEPFVNFSHLEEVFVITGEVDRAALGPAYFEGETR
ncbi:MAG: rod shape-determining protein MreC [bacterium]